MDSAILHKKKLTHSFWLNLMMAAILNSAMLDSDTAILDSDDNLLSSLRLHSKMLSSILTLTQTNSIWLNSDDIRQWPSWTLPSWIQPFCTKLTLAKLVPTIFTKKLKLIHSDSTWWWQPSWTLPCCIQRHLEFKWLVIFSQIHSKTLSLHVWLWLNLIQCLTQTSFILSLNLMMAAILNSAIMDSPAYFAQKNTSLVHSDWISMIFSHLEFCILDSDTAILDCRWLVIFSQIHSKTLSLHSDPDSNFIHSQLTWWWQPSSNLPSWIQPSWFFLSNSLILSKIGSHYLHKKKNFTHSFWLNLMMAAILNSVILDSAIWTKKFLSVHSHSNWWWQPSCILPSWIQPFCTKETSLVHSDTTWWWQPSWILPFWIQTLSSWIQTPCYLLWDSLKNTLPPLWPWLKLIPSD